MYAKARDIKSFGPGFAGFQDLNYDGTATDLTASADMDFGVFVGYNSSDKTKVTVGPSRCLGVTGVGGDSTDNPSDGIATGYKSGNLVAVITRGPIVVQTSGEVVVGNAVYIDTKGKLTGTKGTNDKTAYCRVVSYDATNSLASIILNDAYPVSEA